MPAAFGAITKFYWSDSSNKYWRSLRSTSIWAGTDLSYRPPILQVRSQLRLYCKMILRIQIRKIDSPNRPLVKQ